MSRRGSRIPRLRASVVGCVIILLIYRLFQTITTTTTTTTTQKVDADEVITRQTKDTKPDAAYPTKRITSTGLLLGSSKTTSLQKEEELSYHDLKDEASSSSSFSSSTTTLVSNNNNNNNKKWLQKNLGIYNTQSDVATLDHCNLNDLTNQDLIQYKLLKERVFGMVSFNNVAVGAPGNNNNNNGVTNTANNNNNQMGIIIPKDDDDLIEELSLQILELFSRAMGICDFQLYHHPSFIVVDGRRNYNNDYLVLPSPSTTPPNQIFDDRDDIIMTLIQKRIESIPPPPQKREKPSSSSSSNGKREEQREREEEEEEEEARLVFVISAYEDLEQLKRLIRAIHLEQHLIFIHLETNTDDIEFVSQVRDLMTEPTYYYARNVQVLEFGSVIYPSDSISQINYAIMVWFHHHFPTFQYDYWITLSAASFPLFAAKELAIHLKKTTKSPSAQGEEEEQRRRRRRRRVFLGLLHGGDIHLCRRRAASFGLFYTRGRSHQSGDSSHNNNRLKQQQQKRRVVDIYDVYNLVGGNFTIPLHKLTEPKGLKRSCRRKTTSGNTAAYDYESVQLLTNSTLVKDYFARFKQAGQRCVEESSWGAVLHVIGRKDDDVTLPGMMWQAWPCGRGMGNAYLTSVVPPPTTTTSSSKANSSSTTTVCLRMDDKSLYPDGPTELRSTQDIQKALIKGKQQGHLFARKFHSKDRYWMDWIQNNLHNNNNLSERLP